MANLSLANVVTISASQAPVALQPFNVNNLAMFTADTPNVTFPSGTGYQIYLSPQQVATDFGSSSQTFAMATAMFAQNPNLLTGGGYLVIIPLLASLEAVTQIEKISFSATPTSGAFELAFGGGTTSSIAYGASSSTVQSDIQAGLTGLSSATVTGSILASTGLAVTMTGTSGPQLPITVAANTLLDTNGNPVQITVTTTTWGVASSSTETLLAAILRMQSAISFCGVIKTNAYATNELLTTAAYVQSQNMLLFWASNSSSDATVTTGIGWIMQNSAYSNTRGLMYLLGSYNQANLMAAAYAGLALSVNFNGSNTFTTMHMKQLATIQGDPNMTQGILNACQIAGMDIYPNFNGTAKLFISGANQFFDQVYGQMAWTTSLQTAGFNAIAGTASKIPQTDSGVSALTDAYNLINVQFVTAGWIAPGTWTSPTTFGNVSDFIRLISEVGYYTYAQPVGQQSAPARAARQAPLIQIAAKMAGAVHSSDVLVNVQA